MTGRDPRLDEDQLLDTSPLSGRAAPAAADTNPALAGDPLAGDPLAGDELADDPLAVEGPAGDPPVALDDAHRVVDTESDDVDEVTYTDTDTRTLDRTRLGDYVLVHELGSGGMGEVYGARPVDGGPTVALKTLSRASAANLYRFKREFRALADVAHPNLIKLFELGVESEGRTFFTMELIDGEPFVDWVRSDVEPGQLPDLGRLDAALRQLVAGVRFLHEIGWVHRDLKPSNVLVTRGGRVVILDFGLVSELSEPEHGITHDGQMLGTPAYMAPEQAKGELAGPPADLYAVGVMLYECLTGEKPHRGPLMKILLEKQVSLDLSDMPRQIPPRLRALCRELLERDAKRRLDGPALAARLDVSSVARRDASPASAQDASRSSGVVRREVFVGRRDELSVLHGAVAELRRRRAPVVVHLRGSSGQGKSTLIRRFRGQSRDEGCLVLHGRCRERENVPFKGVDAVVDALSAYLRRLSEEDLDALRPRSVDALVRMFPVLDELWLEVEPQSLGPRELRGVGWGALREVVAGVARHQPLLVIIDDFQWADVDSVQLLDALLGPPEAPALLLILVVRDDVGESEVLRELEVSENLGREAATILELGPLSGVDARELAMQLGGQRSPEVREAWAESLALRARGNPMLIGQLALETETLDSEVDLDDLIAQRLDALDGIARRMLEVVAVSGGPVARDIVLGLCPGAREEDLERLVEDGLLVAGRTSGADELRVETAHDRIRETTQARLGSEELARLNTALAERLLARCEAEPRGELLFRIVDRFNAGILDAEQLGDDARLGLARRNLEVGTRALGNASYALADGYFARAQELVAPWLDQARVGGEHHQLCVEIMLGRLRSVRDEDEGTRLFEEVAGWSLSPGDFGRMCVERMAWLSHHQSREAGVQHCIRALRQMGVRLPRKPSWPWALWHFERGRRVLGREGVEALSRLHEARDESVKSVMTIMAWGGIGVSTASPVWGVGLVGLYAKMLARHGFCDAAGLGVSYLIVVLLSRGKVEEALAFYDALVRCEKAWPMSAPERMRWKWITLNCLPHREPIHQVVVDLAQMHERSIELGQYRNASTYLSVGATMCLDTDMPLPELIALVDRLRARSGRLVDLELARISEQVQSVCRLLIEGPGRSTLLDPGSFESSVAQCGATLRHVWIDVLCDDYGRAWEMVQSHLHDYERALLGYWLTPIYACISVVVMAERWPRVSRAERRRLRRSIRACRKTMARWAAGCRSNYGSMLALVDAEIAGAEGRIGAAMQHYENARQIATEGRMCWVAGLASHRLGILARRHGHSLTAQAALRAARDAYEAWGASVLVQRLDDEPS